MCLNVSHNAGLTLWSVNADAFTMHHIKHSCSSAHFWPPYDVAWKIRSQYILNGLTHTTTNIHHRRSHTPIKTNIHTGAEQYAAQKWPQTLPLPLTLSGFRLNLTPHTWPLGLGSVLLEQREARAQLWGRVHSRADSPLTKGEIQLEHISVQVVEYHSFWLTGNIFSSALMQLPLTSKTVGGPGLVGSHRRALSLNFASSSLRHSIFNLWYISLWSLFSMFLSCTVKCLADLMYERGVRHLHCSPGQPMSVWFPAVGQTKTDRWAWLRPQVPRDTSQDSLQIGLREKGWSWIKADTPQSCSTHNCHLCRLNSHPKWR